MSDLFLELNGKVHSLSETFPGLSVQEVSRQSPQLSMETAEIAGTDGVIPGMTQFKPFIFSAKCNLQALDIPDYHWQSEKFMNFYSSAIVIIFGAIKCQEFGMRCILNQLILVENRIVLVYSL